MNLSVLDLYTIGLGPSSSHTIGPMRAARTFILETLEREAPERISVELYGSLAFTGKGHGTDKAILAGLAGNSPETAEAEVVYNLFETTKETGKLRLTPQLEIKFNLKEDLIFNRKKFLPEHPNGMFFQAFNNTGNCIHESVLFSIGGGFIVDSVSIKTLKKPSSLPLPYPFNSGKQLLQHCDKEKLKIHEVIHANELVLRNNEALHTQLDQIWAAMQAAVQNGIQTSGVLPGGLKVARRAPQLYSKLIQSEKELSQDQLHAIDWINLYAIAVNEENASGGRVVTAPTNGASGVIPAVMHYVDKFIQPSFPQWHHHFLLTAGAIGILFKENASISGADVGCQGEVGVACSMAAGALAEIMGGTPAQVENAAEIGMEHNLGLTCDPIGGLVQIPCIERNAMGAVKAVNAARLALKGEGKHNISLDAVVKTMRETGRDMKRKYKETSQGGLAVNYTEC